jgi:hypothetical protein
MTSLGNLNFDIQSNSTIKLLRTIGSPLISNKKSFVDGTESLELYDLAVKNKIPLLYLESIKQQGKLNKLKMKYDEEYARYLKFLDGVGKVSKILDAADIEYVIFKTVKPYPAVPGDVDIVVLGNNDEYRRANGILLKAGYREEEAKAIGHELPDLIDPEGDIIIDLQDELELSYVIYMDKNKFRGHIVKTVIPSGVEIKTLTPELDLAITIIHSLTEYLYLLGEYYTFLYMLSIMNEREIDGFITILKENKITAAAKSFITIVTILHKIAYGVIPEKLEYLLDKIGHEKSEAGRLVKSDFKMPHRYGISTLVKVILEKMGERRFRRSVALQLIKMLNPRLIKHVIGEVIERQRREYYLKEMK